MAKFIVTVRPKFPAWNYQPWDVVVEARTRSEANKRARRDLERDGHVFTHSEAVTFSARPAPVDTGTNPKKRAAALDQADLARAKRLYEGFTGHAPRTLKRLTVPRLPKTALCIGRIFGVLYEVTATGERLHHEFKGKARPLLLVSSDGHQVFLRGGAYTFTKRGFVDKK